MFPIKHFFFPVKFHFPHFSCKFSSPFLVIVQIPVQFLTKSSEINCKKVLKNHGKKPWIFSGRWGTFSLENDAFTHFSCKCYVFSAIKQIT